ncbi:hypothetical protein BY458DRAFT_514933 [Sporodiniella umbellata]|nr:hypothetical protein BY458DRAFT_514933 [Sporodiniella umbellata]
MEKVKVAVIGSGLAGLSAAYLLSQNKERFQVHLFEKNASVGMDASSISIGPSKEHRIDVPMRSFMSGYYSHLLKLYEHLKIPAKKAKFSFGWYMIRQGVRTTEAASEQASFTRNEPYLTYSGVKTMNCLNRTQYSKSQSGWEQLESFMSSLWTSWIVIFSYFQILLISLYMHHRGHLKNPHHSISHLTLADFFAHYHIHSYFAHKVFIPLFAAVCTNSYQSMLEYPASDVLEYLALGFHGESYVAGCGVQQVVERLSQPLDHVHLETQIVRLEKLQHGYRITDDHEQTYVVDHLVFATQGNQAAQLLQPLGTANEQLSLLENFVYDPALVINHTDTRLLPSDPADWKVLNLAMKDRAVKSTASQWIVPHETTMTTHILNMSHPIAKDCIYMQTTNPCLSVDPKKVLSVAWFERATVTLKSKQALAGLFQSTESGYTLGPSQGLDGIWFVGSYCWKGIPLLEGCVASAEYVVTQGIAASEGISLHVPWNA